MNSQLFSVCTLTTFLLAALCRAVGSNPLCVVRRTAHCGPRANFIDELLTAWGKVLLYTLMISQLIKIFRLLWNQKVHLHVYKSPALFRIPRQRNTAQHFVKFNFNIIPQSTRKYLKWFASCRLFWLKLCAYCFFLVSSRMYSNSRLFLAFFLVLIYPAFTITPLPQSGLYNSCS